MAKTIVITGAGDGLGRALARRFAKDGETVILLGRTLAKVQAVADELGAPAVAIQCDVANPDSVRAAFATIAAAFSRIDVLINNAGVYVPFTLAEVQDNQVKDLLDINVAGTVYCSRDALPLLRGDGHIINVTSESAAVKMPMMWLYASAKHAVELMSDMWARELEDDKVRRPGRWMSPSALPRPPVRSASSPANAASRITIMSPTPSAPSSTCRRMSTWASSRSTPASHKPERGRS